jgi:threonine dehydratase
VFVPAFVPAAKAALIVAYGTTLHRVDGFYADALAASLAHAEQHSAQHVNDLARAPINVAVMLVLPRMA